MAESADPRGRLRERVALIVGAGQTGGEKIGNGRASAVLFAREGAKLLLFDRDRAAAEQTAAQILREGARAEVFEGDVRSEADCRAAVAACVERLGGLHVVHHNVGVGRGDGWVEGIDFRSCHSFLPGKRCCSWFARC